MDKIPYTACIMKKSQFILCVLIALLSASNIARAQDIRLYDLRCNNTTNPIGIDDTHPTLSWKIASTARGEKQTAYQLMVGLTENDLERAPVWNSGKVVADQSVHVPYGGPALENGKRYFWKVKVWDRHGKESPYSVAQFWETAVNTQHFTAAWISAPVVFDFEKLNRHRYAMIKGETHDFLEPMPLLRRKFDVKQNIVKATVYVAAPGFFELFINGKKSFRRCSQPSFHKLRQDRALFDLRCEHLLEKRSQCLGRDAGQRLVQLYFKRSVGL